MCRACRRRGVPEATAGHRRDPRHRVRLRSHRRSRSTRDARRPPPQADPHTLAVCIAQCEQILERRRRRHGLSAQVRSELLSAPGEMPGLDAVAASLHMHPRTVRRRLAEEGTSFRALTNDVRATLATELLSQVGLTVEQVARRLGANRRRFGDAGYHVAAAACTAGAGSRRCRGLRGPSSSLSRHGEISWLRRTHRLGRGYVSELRRCALSPFRRGVGLVSGAAQRLLDVVRHLGDDFLDASCSPLSTASRMGVCRAWPKFNGVESSVRP